jgi:hypothetical protein
LPDALQGAYVISTPGHGYLAVPRATFQKHAAAYRAAYEADWGTLFRGGYVLCSPDAAFVYLEEDCECPAFLKAAGCEDAALDVPVRHWRSNPEWSLRFETLMEASK